MKNVTTKKIVGAGICGILAYVFHYIILLPFLMESFDTRALSVLQAAYWWYGALGPILFMPLIMKWWVRAGKSDWKFYLLIPIVQLLLLPLLYYYVTVVVDHGKTGVLMWVLLGFSVLKMALVETGAAIVIHLLTSSSDD